MLGRAGVLSAHPDSCGCEFHECEIVGGVLLVPGGDGSEVLELVEEALDAVPRRYRKGLKAGLSSRRASGLMLAKTPRAVMFWRRRSLS